MSDISYWNLDYSDIIDIFKNNLKIENTLRSIQSIFLNERYASKIDFKPYFQRNYVWDKEKASYFIESILLGTEIPPLVLFKGNVESAGKNEVIDGRQRYETLLRFLNNDFPLESGGLHRLYDFSNLHYADFDDDIKDSFTNTKLRILQCNVTNEPSLTLEKEDKIKKEIFKRYNSGITPLKSEENARAEYINDAITQTLKAFFDESPEQLEKAEEILLSKSKLKLPKRDKVNVLLDRIRTLFAMSQIPIYNYAKSSHRSDIIRKFYNLKIAKMDPDKIKEQFVKMFSVLYAIKMNIDAKASFNNYLLYEALGWGILIAADQGIDVSIEDAPQIANVVSNSKQIHYLWNDIINSVKEPEAIFEQTGSHYRNATLDRYRFVCNYFKNNYKISFEKSIKNTERFTQVMDTIVPKRQLQEMKLNKPDPVSVTIDDVLTEMKQSKFLVRPQYQRSEVKNIKKSSYLIESIMLGITIPPIYIYRRKDKVKEVIDGQQRILTILGFLGKSYIDENNKEQLSNKHKFKLSGLKILKELNGCTVDDISGKWPQYIDNILDFSINVVEINEEQNPQFNSIDLFLRLNTKPFPITPNSFEMWNAYVAQPITQKIKDLAEKYDGSIFHKKDTRMSNEELITALAYLHYQINFRNAKYKDLLTIYLRDNHICSRIASKDRITKMLEGLTPQSLDDFNKSIDAVQMFVKKIALISGNDGKHLPMLWGTRQKTDQNFYFMWIILEHLSANYIKANREKIFSSIRDRFSTIVAAKPDTNVDLFLKDLPLYEK
ncbi:DUF262 domain-containing protein [Fournierella massiliensis]|uniref:DUF262 domain-containing protein n=1 Tax=Allofournierella massiliensis TaxID=1650663 RepID=UPI0035207DD1